MATVRSFPFLRPVARYAEQTSCLPYDVMSHHEAKAMAAGKIHSFLRIARSDIEFHDESLIHAPETYAKARENLLLFEKEGVLARDPESRFGIYRQIMNGRVQTGLVGTVSVDEYLDGSIKRHELTRKEKELDRICHFEACSAQTEPVFLAYRRDLVLEHLMNEWIKFHKPDYDFTSDDGVTHIFWSVDDEATIASLREAFERIDSLYIADGHHRTASGVETCLRRRKENPAYTGDEEFNFLMAVIFPDEDLFIMDYNRVVRDLNGLDRQDFLLAVESAFIVEPTGEKLPRPTRKHEFGMFLDGLGYKLTVREGLYDENDPIASLDCAILQDKLLAPVLGIDDPRTNSRIDFIGGIRGPDELERRCDPHKGDMRVAFSLYPVTMDDLFRVADAGQIMPPKSTWFEPKLRSGLFVHSF